MKLKDRIANKYYTCRYKFYAKFAKRKLKDSSPKFKKRLKLVFNDDFNEISWSRKQNDNRKWGIGEHWGAFHPRNGRSWWTEPILNNDSTISCITKYEPKTFYRKTKDGHWHSSCTNFDPIETKVVPFSSGGLSTGHKKPDGDHIFKQQYGRWECRCRVPIEKGVRSAYWMWGSSWPPEIDVFEIDGKDDNQYINLHYGVNVNGKHPSIGGHNAKCLRLGEFQEFVLDWTPEKIEMYTDGIKIFQCTDKNVLKWYNAEDAQMWVLIYQSVIGDVEKPNTPPISEFVVDYVRVYKNI